MKSDFQDPRFKNISVVIAAAGKGTRSGLDYPKCLYRIKKRSILERIIDTLYCVDPDPIIITSRSGREQIFQEVSRLKVNANLIIQENQNGMGDAVMQLNQVKKSLQKNILLIWGDVPFISRDTIERLIYQHFSEDNHFTLPTIFADHPYTIIQRDDQNSISSVIETKINPKVAVPTRGERDLGLFLFDKNTILDLLVQDLPKKINDHDSEHGFLYLIEHLYNKNFKIGSIEVTNQKESISFNSLDDLSIY